MERQVKWSKLVALPKGMSGEGLYTSKCSRYTIEKTLMSVGRGRWGAPMYTLTIVASGKTSQHDQLVSAKDGAEYDINPNWDPA